ncbi:MAG: DUF975 family protein [Oscillospiraceae bacterium]|jgi:uncharacterized membrane protein|nr:DUF975 family protein [Oscillospiraceae bacterium]
MVDRYSLKQSAKGQIRGNIGILFVCYLIVAAITGFSVIIPIVGTLIVEPPLMLGMIMIYLALQNGRAPEVSDVFGGFRFFGQSILLYIEIAVFTFLWSLLFVIPGIIKGLSYSMAPYILADNPGISASEALNESKRIMHGYKADLFVLGLSFFPWMLLVTITFGLAGIYVVPYVQATTANFYIALRDSQSADYYGD